MVRKRNLEEQASHENRKDQPYKLCALCHSLGGAVMLISLWIAGTYVPTLISDWLAFELLHASVVLEKLFLTVARNYSYNSL
jgi:hypothetical protein